jgi:hypothetical protein
MASTNAKSSVFQFNDCGGTLRTLYCDLNSIDYKRSRAIAKFETFCAIEKSPGNVDVGITVGGEWVGTTNEIDAVMHGLVYCQVPQGYKYGPAGSGAGAVMYSGTSYCTDYSISAKTGGIVEVSATFEGVGDDVRSTW